jgi:uncharacterized membrane protein
MIKFIDFVFECATYVMLCLVIGFAVGYVLAGPKVLDIIINLIW